MHGHVYMLTVGMVLTTNVSQINLCQLCLRAILNVRLGLCLSGLRLQKLTVCSLITKAIKSDFRVVNLDLQSRQTWNPIKLILLSCQLHKHTCL